MNDKLRILVVEDDSSWQEIYEEVLVEENYLVEVATNLGEARKIIDSCFCHVAIVDIKLNKDDPENRDGLKVLQHIWELNEGTAGIVASAHAKVSMFDEFRRYGVFDLAEKSSWVPDDALRDIGKAQFIKGGIDKGDLDSASIIEIVKRAVVGAQRSAIRAIWTASPFSFINGLSARDVQRAMGGGQMVELRPFLGDLCRPFMPWLKAKEKPAEIEVDGRCVGFQTPCWSRSLGEAVVVRFGRHDLFEKAMRLSPVSEISKIGKVGKELKRDSSSHFMGAVYLLEDADFEQHFTPPALKRSITVQD